MFIADNDLPVHLIKRAYSPGENLLQNHAAFDKRETENNALIRQAVVDLDKKHTQCFYGNDETLFVIFRLANLRPPLKFIIKARCPGSSNIPEIIPRSIHGRIIFSIKLCFTNCLGSFTAIE